MVVERAEQITLPEVDATRDVRPHRRLFDVDEYYRMAEFGILKPDERVELIEGEIYLMSPVGGRHAWNVDRLNRVLMPSFGDRVWLRVQNPIRLARRVEPEPDFSISRLDPERLRRYRTSHPGPEDVLLVIEVAETSLDYDLGEKSVLYARYGIPELWVLDLPDDRLIYHRDPTPTGYANVDCLTRDDLRTLSPVAFPDVTFTADELLGEAVAEAEGTGNEDQTDAEATGDG